MTKALKVFSREEMSTIAEAAAEKAAEKAVHRLFSSLDINLNDIDDVRRFRDNQRFLSQQREGTEYMKNKVREGAYAAVGLLLLWLVYISWDVLKAGWSAVSGH